MSAVKNVIKDNYNMMLLRDFLRERIKDAGFSHAEISKTPTGTRVALHVTRPGIVIGRKGVGIRELTEKLNTEFGLKNPQISVIEIPKPELSPNVMCNRMASHIERGTAFRRATMWTMQQIMDSGAMGVQITISGKLRGDRSAFEKHTAGILPRAGHHADVIVDEDIAHVRTPMGLIGIRIRIAIKEKVIPEFELKKDESKEETVEEKKPETVEEKKPETVEEKKPETVEEKKPETVEEKKPETESEQIIIEEEKMKDLETLEEEEEKMK
ncbi:MAG: 30S ribosomal protein S3 [Thaumarchaeota archaeon]|nr:30S ribosomal protein S3 [Nitrososphaerota archaeon]